MKRPASPSRQLGSARFARGFGEGKAGRFTYEGVKRDAWLKIGTLKTLLPVSEAARFTLSATRKCPLLRGGFEEGKAGRFTYEGVKRDAWLKIGTLKTLLPVSEAARFTLSATRKGPLCEGFEGGKAGRFTYEGVKREACENAVHLKYCCKRFVPSIERPVSGKSLLIYARQSSHSLAIELEENDVLVWDPMAAFRAIDSLLIAPKGYRL